MREMSEWVEYMTLDGVSPMSDLRKKNGREKPWRVDYFGVGNENWGCGGNMTPAYYADLYRRYQTYVRTYDSNAPIFRICGGANADDYKWTEVVLRECFAEPAPKEVHGMMDGLSVHYYCGAEKGPHKGSATDFSEDDYWYTMNRALGMDELIYRHGAIMDQYDPDKKIGMMVDEWGCWHEPEKDTNPGFLYQQNTMRDAIAAAIQLNIFNRHSKRVKMANLAQMVNVLQSVLLSEGDTMVKTPTYHVFDIFKNHQGADAVYCYIQNENMVEGMNTPMISCSASISENQMTITLVNASLSEAAEISGQIYGFLPHSASARILSAEAHAFNDFDSPDKVHIISCVVSLKDRIVSITLPPCSIAEIHLT